MNDNIKVSIICHVYNHEKYLRRCLDGFCCQKTTFPYEAIIHDDASTDGSKSIIEEYFAKYPDIIHPIFQNNNQYSKGINIFKTFTLPVARGEYIATCEGDDYWIDEYKLQKQFEALENHPELDFCTHSSYLVEASTEKTIRELSNSKKEQIFSTKRVIYGEVNNPVFVSTSSFFYRRKIWDNPLPFTQIMSLDLVTQINAALRGGMYYLPEYMSCYRWHSENSWTLRMRANEPYRLRHREQKIKMLQQLDTDTFHQYHDAVMYRILKVELQNEDNYVKAITSKKYRSVFQRLSLRDKCSMVLKRILHYAK